MEKKQSFLTNIAFYGIIAAAVILFLKFGLKYVMPFLLAFFIDYCCRGLIEKLMRKAKLNRKVSSVIVLTCIILVLALVVFLLGVSLVSGVQKLFEALPGMYEKRVEPYVQQILTWYEKTDLVELMGPTIGGILESTADNILSDLGSVVTSMSMKVVSFATGVVSRFPSFLMTTLITMIAAYFMAFDFDNILGFIKKQMKPRTLELVRYIKNNFFGTIIKYLLGYGTILAITFGEMILVMLLAKVSSPIVTAFVISMLDFLPIIGVGTVVIPWVIIDLVASKYYQAVVLFLGWIAITIVRNVIEPKIVGNKVGLHPVIALIAMYVGLRAFGLFGMLGIPVCLVMLNEMQEADIIHFYRK